MLAKLRSFAILGIDALPVDVEVDSATGNAKVILVGLPEMAVRESVHRVERALANLGYARPTGRVIISLAPADLRKEGGAFDLPIALGILVATRQLNPSQVEQFGTVGELALDGTVRPIKGAPIFRTRFQPSASWHMSFARRFLRLHCWVTPFRWR